MQAIHVKVMPATSTKGMRYKALGLGMCAITSNDYNLNGEANAAYAAQELLDNYNTQHKLQYKIQGVGTLPDGTYAVLLEAIRH